MRNSFLTKVMAVLMIAVLMTSFMVVSASAAVSNQSLSEPCTYGSDEEKKMCNAIKEQFSFDSDTKWSTSTSSGSPITKKYQIKVDGMTKAFYVNKEMQLKAGTIGGCVAGTNNDAEKTCKKLQEMFGSNVQFSMTETTTCKYLTSISLNGVTKNVYVNV